MTWQIISLSKSIGGNIARRRTLIKAFTKRSEKSKPALPGIEAIMVSKSTRQHLRLKTSEERSHRKSASSAKANNQHQSWHDINRSEINNWREMKKSGVKVSKMKNEAWRQHIIEKKQRISKIILKKKKSRKLASTSAKSWKISKIAPSISASWQRIERRSW